MLGSHAVAAITKRVPGLKRLPVLKLIAIAELAVVARKHFEHLTPTERRRLGELMRHPRSLSRAEKDELSVLVAKLEPRAFAGATADAFSPVPLPKRFTKAKY
jgi:hypothetical protein